MQEGGGQGGGGQGQVRSGALCGGGGAWRRGRMKEWEWGEVVS